MPSCLTDSPLDLSFVCREGNAAPDDVLPTVLQQLNMRTVNANPYGIPCTNCAIMAGLCLVLQLKLGSEPDRLDPQGNDVWQLMLAQGSCATRPFSDQVGDGAMHADALGSECE